MRLDDEVQWEKISVDRDQKPLPPNEYMCLVREANDEAPSDAGKQPFVLIIAEVQEGEFMGREIRDYIYPKTKKGTVNKTAMGQIKEWADATVGADRLSSKDFDTKEFEGHTVRILTKLESYEKDDTTPGAAPGAKKSFQTHKIAKVMRA